MKNMEQLELEGHRSEIIADVESLIDKYRAIFEWDVPEVDEGRAEKLILMEIRKAVDDVESKWRG